MKQVAPNVFSNSRLIVQRLTAIWAFTESGLGGMMHAFKIPFTGLVIGGMSVLLISLIAFFSPRPATSIFKSALTVLLIKAMVSPQSPLPAYLAVSFQALVGMLLFRIASVNIFSLMIFSVLANLESAFQKLLLLTFFFGKSLWTAMDQLMDFIGKQFHVHISNYSYWLVGLYIGLYLMGAVFVALFTQRFIQDLKNGNCEDQLNRDLDFQSAQFPKTSRVSSLIYFFILLSVISLILFLAAGTFAAGWMAVLKSVVWTLSAILFWYVVLIPVSARLLKKILQRRKGKNREELDAIVLLFPAFRKIAVRAWLDSQGFSGIKKIRRFVTLFLIGSLFWQSDAMQS